MKVDWSARLKALMAQAPIAFQRGIKVHDLVALMGGDTHKSVANRILNNGVKLGVLFVAGNNQDKRYFTTIQQARAFEPAPKRCMPAVGPRSKPKGWDAADVYHPKDVETQYCPAGIDHRHTAVEPFPKVFSSLPIGVYL